MTMGEPDRPFRKRSLDGTRVCDHIVQLFDTSESLVSAVTAFIADGVAQEAHVAVAVRSRHWLAIAHQLDIAGCAIGPALDDGRFTVLNADETLGRFLREGRPDRRLFDAHVGQLIRALCRQAKGDVRVFGEMVDILADDGNFIAAEELEQLWNDLAEEADFTLFCGYASSNFASLRGAPALPAICRAHSQIRTTPGDILGLFLTHGQAALRSPGPR